jgi:hypothetical protein
MKFDFDAIYAKLDRAHDKAEELKKRLNAITEGEPNELRMDLDPYSGEFSLYLDHVEAVPDDVPFILSETIHHFRSALDHLIYELSHRPTGPKSRRVRFPIFLSDADFRKYNGDLALRFLSKTNRARVKRLQPYNRVDAQQAHLDGLWILDTLWNIDKHRTLLIANRSVRVRSIDWRTTDGLVVDERWFDVRWPKPGAKLGEGWFRRNGPYPKLSVYALLHAEIAFDRGCGDAAGMQVMPTIEFFERDIRENVLREFHRPPNGSSPPNGATAVEGIVP